MEILDAGFRFHNISVELKCDVKPLKIHIVKGELVQALINILNNAKDVLKTKEGNRWVKVECFEKGGNAIVTVEDNGGGVPKEIISKIFNAYFTTKHQSQGTGIGLYMSKKIIEQNDNGKLFVKNTKNGAKFYIVLPLAGGVVDYLIDG